MDSPPGDAASSRDEAPVVFISHSSVDRDVAVAICRALEDAGVRCWMAPRDILEGVEWDEAITDGVERAFLVVLVLSRQSNASPEVAREVRGAVTRKLPILPFCVEDVPPSKALDYALSTAHRFAAYEPPLDDHLRRLVGVVREHVAARGVPLSARPRSRGLRSLGRSVGANALLFAVAGFALLSLDLLGATGLSERYSQDLLNQVLAPYYPRSAQEKLSVVLITDGALEQLEEPWPASYGFHAQVLTAILLDHPRAVMIDLLFKDRRRDDTLPQLQRALQRFQEAKVPVYLAAGSSRSGAIRSEIAPYVIPVPVPKVSDRYDRATREYRLVLSEYGAVEQTAALRLYNDLELASPLGDAELSRDFGSPMQIFWGTLPPDGQREWIDCDPPPLTAGAAAWRRLFGGQDALQTDCYYAQTIPVDYMFTRSSDPRVAGLIRDKIVLYGASLVGIEDYVYPPTHTRLPGVFMHAMALDNLMTFGTGYMRRPPSDSALGRWRSALEILILAVYGAMVGLRDEVRETLRSRRARSVTNSGFAQVVLLTNAVTLAALLFSLAVTWWAFRAQHLASINWLGCFGVALIIMMAKEWAVRFGNRSSLLKRY